MTAQPFYNHVTESLFFGSLPHWQQEPLDRLIQEGLRRKQSLARIAYVMATAYHETGRFKYMEEIGEGRGRDYGHPLVLIRGQTVKYHGRGFVQLTWLRNYARMSVLLSLEHGYEIDLVNQPDLAKDPEIASLIIWEGMVRGEFTGHNLADHIRPGAINWTSARRIVNGLDKAELIAGYADKFLTGLELSTECAA